MSLLNASFHRFVASPKYIPKLKSVIIWIRLAAGFTEARNAERASPFADRYPGPPNYTGKFACAPDAPCRTVFVIFQRETRMDLSKSWKASEIIKNLEVRNIYPSSTGLTQFYEKLACCKGKICAFSAKVSIFLATFSRASGNDSCEAHKTIERRGISLTFWPFLSVLHQKNVRFR